MVTTACLYSDFKRTINPTIFKEKEKTLSPHYEILQQSSCTNRSANDGYVYSGVKIIQWISMLQDVYEKFDPQDLDCQKRLICEVMREPEYYGNVAQKFKSGFQYAKYLEVLSLPDDIR